MMSLGCVASLWMSVTVGCHAPQIHLVGTKQYTCLTGGCYQYTTSAPLGSPFPVGGGYSLEGAITTCFFYVVLALMCFDSITWFNMPALRCSLLGCHLLWPWQAPALLLHRPWVRVGTCASYVICLENRCCPQQVLVHGVSLVVGLSVVMRPRC